VNGLSTITFGWPKENELEGMKWSDGLVVPLSKDKLMDESSLWQMSAETELNVKMEL